MFVGAVLRLLPASGVEGGRALPEYLQWHCKVRKGRGGELEHKILPRSHTEIENNLSPTHEFVITQIQ